MKAKLLLLTLISPLLWGQIDGTLHLWTNSPSAPPNVGVSLTGPQGANTWCYAVIARYPVGNASQQGSAPQCITNAPGTMTVFNYATISWTPLQGTTGYDVIRLPNTTVQSCTGCLVASNTSVTTVVDNGQALGNYTIIDVGSAQCIISINNRDYNLPRIVVPCAFPFQIGGCLVFPDGTQQCTSSIATGSGPNVPNVEWAAVAALAPGTTLTLNTEIRQPFTFHNADWNVSGDLGQMPTGQNAIIDIQISHDHGGTWASIFPVGNANKINIVPGGATFGTVTTFAVAGALAGDWVKVLCIQAGSGAPGQGIQGKLY